MSLKKLAARNETIRKAIEQKYPNWLVEKEPQLGNEKFNAFRDGIATIFQQINYNPQTELDNSTLKQLFDVKPTSYIKWLACSPPGNLSVDCHSMTRVESLRSRHCTTLFYLGAVWYDLANNRQLFNTSESNYTSYFDAKEVVKLVLDFEPEDYADLKRQIGSRIIFHDNSHIASSQDLDFFLTRGFRYDFNIEREDIVFNGKPYWNCLDYHQMYQKVYNSQVDPRIPLDMDGCFQNCIARNIVKREDCWPSTMPYYRNDSMNLDESIKICTTFGEADRMAALRDRPRFESLSQLATNQSQFLIAGVRARARHKLYMKVQRFCRSRCVSPCRRPSFSVVVAQSPWPADVQVIQKSFERHLRHCCALVTVKFSHFHYTIQEYMPKYNIMDTLGNIGGLLAVWLGLSIVSVYHALQKCVELCKQRTYQSKVHSDNEADYHTKRFPLPRR